jgi:hypothetical protein
MEFPPATLRVAGAQLPAAGGAYLRLLPYRLVASALRQAERRHVPGTFYLHPWELDPGQPRLDVSRATRIRHYGGLGGMAGRVERLLDEFRFQPIATTFEGDGREASAMPRLPMAEAGVISHEPTRWLLRWGRHGGVGRVRPRVLEVPPSATWPAWRPLIAEVMGHEPVYLAARSDGGEIVGVLPMFRLRSWIFGSRMVSMPFLNYGGPLGEPPAVAALLGQAVQEAMEAGVKDMELRTPRIALPSDLAVTDRKVTVLLPLPPEPEELWSSFKAKVRSQIRRPMKEGMEPRFGPEQVEPFYEVYSRNMRDLGTPVLPKAVLRARRHAFSRGSHLRCGVLRWEACRRRGRVPVQRRVRDHLGFRPPGAQPSRAQHAAVLVAHGGGDPARGDHVQLRPVHAGGGDTPVQAPVGWAGSSAPVAVVAGGAGGASPTSRGGSSAW